MAASVSYEYSSVCGSTPKFCRQTRNQRGPKAQPIPAWGNALGNIPQIKPRAESPAHQSIPHVSLSVFHPVFFQKHPKLILKRPCAMVVFLVVNISIIFTTILRQLDFKNAVNYHWRTDRQTLHSIDLSL